MEGIQIALLITAILLSLMIIVGGYLYVRTQSMKERVQQSIKEVETLNVEAFESRLLSYISKTTDKEVKEVLELTREEFNQIKIHNYTPLLDDLKNADAKLNAFWLNPFRDAKRILYNERTFDDYEYRKWYQIKRPFHYFTKHIVFLEESLRNMKVSFINIQIEFTRNTQIKELDEKYLSLIKDEYRRFKEQIQTSVHPELRDSQQYSNILETIDIELNNLSGNIPKLTEHEINHQLNELRKDVVHIGEIASVISTGKDFLDKESDLIFNKVRTEVRENAKYFGSLKNKLNDLQKKIKDAKIRLDRYIKTGKIELAKTNIERLDKELVELQRVSYQAVAAGEIIENNHEQIINIVRELDKVKIEVAKEISKFTNKLYTEWVKKHEDDFKAIKIAASTYENQRRQTYQANEPWDLLTKQSEIKEKYLAFLSKVDVEVHNIRKQLEFDKEIREYIIKFNNTMLNIDSLIDRLPDAIGLKYANQIQKGKRYANNLIKVARSEEFNDDIYKNAKQLQELGHDLFVTIATEGLLSVYVRQVILLLNLLNKNDKYTSKINRMKQIYNEDGDFKLILKEALPILKKVKQNERNNIN